MAKKDGRLVATVCLGETPPPFSSPTGMDCDDNDSATNPRATEVCDGLDNDCDGQVDELMSCGSLRGVSDAALTGRQWRAVAVHPSGYPVWVAGLDGTLAVKMSAEAPFVSHDADTATGCGPSGNSLNWHAAWVNPGNGAVVIAGQGGWLAEHNGDSCVRAQQINLPEASDDFAGIVGVGEPLQIFVSSTGGALYEWKADPLHHDSPGKYWGLHALGADALYAVGSMEESAPMTPMVNLHTRQGGSEPIAQTLQGTADYEGSLRAVWAASTTLIYAVGDSGLVVKGSSQSREWERVLPPSGPAVNYVSIAVPPGTETAYVMGNDGNRGRLHRLTPHGWANAPAFTPSAPDVPLRDIAMTSAENFWIVGDDGHVYHFPEP
ncbi:putative metal-binding motif-containing protein [Myxococcus sp. MxC21-1]|uniref:putative metal-binding motif-containing protein n=1 Tax=Myxococcus sp. MxC21-1 TaxID=3041439 RepID=UPI00292ED5FE|nr:putative metal-binding motif-containing protein [Myxococcus sp. MxC21-1]WNZ66142.1 putative metal-binding motif-containing protein [Myxococcus sp. MxC21-1]